MRCTPENGGGGYRYVSILILQDEHLTIQPQDLLEAKKPGTTLILIILSSDQTQLMHFSNKTAYPVYMTIGSIPKYIR